MAMAHEGSHPQGTPRLRILVCLCELAQTGKPATYRDVQRGLGMSAGSVSHHIAALVNDGSLTRHGQARGLQLTPAAFAELIAGGWLEPVRRGIAFELSSAATELLELGACGCGQPARGGAIVSEAATTRRPW